MSKKQNLSLILKLASKKIIYDSWGDVVDEQPAEIQLDEADIRDLLERLGVKK